MMRVEAGENGASQAIPPLSLLILSMPLLKLALSRLAFSLTRLLTRLVKADEGEDSGVSESRR